MKKSPSIEIHANMGIQPTDPHEHAVALNRLSHLMPLSVAHFLDQRRKSAPMKLPALHFRQQRRKLEAQNVAVEEAENAPAVCPVVATPHGKIRHADKSFDHVRKVPESCQG